jgi:hypothetical protein
VIEGAFAGLEPVIGVKPACELTGKSRATVYRRRNPRPVRWAHGGRRHRTPPRCWRANA